MTIAAVESVMATLMVAQAAVHVEQLKEQGSNIATTLQCVCELVLKMLASLADRVCGQLYREHGINFNFHQVSTPSTLCS